MAPGSTTASIILASRFFILGLSFWSNHVEAASPPLSFSFDFSNTSNYRLQDLRFEGDASLNGELVDLTCNPTYRNCSGRMSYNHRVPLYDSNTGEVASFVTTFTFAINLLPNTIGKSKGDGMTFFLSGYPSRLPPGSHNSHLGLTNNSKIDASGTDRFLAVEFDTYANPLVDATQATDHMGIDLNSITSVMTTRLPAYSLNGTMTATITYNSATATLEATLYFDPNRSLHPYSVKTQLPDRLDALLPSEVAVGFSASTGGSAELHQIHAWSFNSTMAAGGFLDDQDYSFDEPPMHARIPAPRSNTEPAPPAPPLDDDALAYHNKDAKDDSYDFIGCVSHVW
ncbi:hypothetical protein QYE76_037093 [Lolium multiflorum]|uniref:Legume lectin domain-containing protein n=1 Tax=Lolium multiflorum TaxID=4521 RepID=A0AAD8R3Q1_LOLMU|nr:hypothetical protein QYE76_037010 [Lolium multiflorum]KAK1613420.1 hypothetical protein QYE76_037093 [Lolium multiflorum]